MCVAEARQRRQHAGDGGLHLRALAEGLGEARRVHWLVGAHERGEDGGRALEIASREGRLLCLRRFERDRRLRLRLFGGLRVDDASARALIVGTQPTNEAALFLRRAFGVERDKTRENLFV